jgi:uncharacterized protein
VRVLLSGASGLLGRAVRDSPAADGHEVLRLVRREPMPGAREVAWPAPAPPPGADLDGLDAIVHLAGVGLASGVWTRARRQAIRGSRVDATAGLARAAAACPHPPRAFVCASAVGIYGDRGDEKVDEDSPPGAGFLAELVRDWEAATVPAARAGIRVVNARFGIVLSRAGGALARMIPAFRLGLGARLGDGRQSMSWVTRHDAVRAIRFALDAPAVSGPVNVVAGAVTNVDFTRALAGALRRPAPFVAPRALLTLLAGDLAREALLAGQHVRAERLPRAGFTFAETDLDAALSRIVRGGPPPDPEMPGPPEGAGPGGRSAPRGRA